MKLQVVLIASKRIALLSLSIFEALSVHLIGSKTEGCAVPEAIKTRLKSIFLVPEVFNPTTLVMEYDRGSMVEILERLTREFSPEAIRIVCSQEANLELAAYLRERFSIKGGLRPEQLTFFRDKVEMKKRLVSHGIRVPKFIARIPDGADPQAQFESLQGFFSSPFVIKPRASVGSRSVYKIWGQADFEHFLKTCEGEIHLYEAEALIEGDLYHCDVAVQGGQVLTALASRCSRHTIEFQHGKNLGSIPLRHEDETAQRLLAFAKKALRALGNREGCFHMELFLSNSDTIVFLEVGARAAGLFTVPIYRDTFGIDLLEMDFLIQSGFKVPKQPESIAPESYSFFMVFPKREGRIKALNTPEIRSPYHLDWQVEEGEQTRRTKTNVDYAGMMQVWNKDYDDLRRDFEYLNDDFIPIQYGTAS